MKKFFSLIAVFVVILMGGFILTACGGGNDITYVGLIAYIEDGVFLEYDSEKSNQAEKRNEFTLNLTYGETIDLSKIKMDCSREKDNYEVIEKTDFSNGYVLDIGNFSTNTLPTVGTYKLTYTYEGWTNIVNIVVNRAIVEIPHFEDGDDREVYYDGNDYTYRIKYNKNLVTMVSAPEIRKEPIDAYDQSRYYNVEFKLNDANNYCWNLQDGATGEYLTENYIFEFAINKSKIIIDVGKYVNTNNDRYKEDEGLGENYKTFKYEKNENKTLKDILSEIVDQEVIKELLDSNKIKLEIIHSNNTIFTMEQIEAGAKADIIGLYTIKLVNLDAAHYNIVDENDKSLEGVTMFRVK